MESAEGKPVEQVVGQVVVPFGYTYAKERGEGVLFNSSVGKWLRADLEGDLEPWLTYIAPIKRPLIELMYSDLPNASLVDHPPHYGGEQDPYEAIKVIEAWGLGFNLGNLLKYVCRAGKKDSRLKDLKKALWYLQREITLEEKNEASKT